MAPDAGDDRADRRQVDVVVGVDAGAFGRAERMVAVRAGGERCLDDPVRVQGERAGDAGAAATGLLAAVRQVRLLAFAGRHAGVVGGLGRGGEPGFEFADARGQDGDLLRLRFEQGNQVIAREREKGCAVHTRR